MVGGKGHDTAAARGVDWDAEKAAGEAAGWAVPSAALSVVEGSVEPSEEKMALPRVRLAEEKRAALSVFVLVAQKVDPMESGMELAMVEWMVCRVAASMEPIWGEEQVATMDTSLACGKDCWMAVQSETSGVAQKVSGAAERMDVGAAAQTVGTRAGGMVSASVPRLA